MKELGNLLKEKRESKGVSISEASTDLQIKEVILENIEEGNIGAFKDIYILKENIKSFAKYLGLDADHLLDEFNEYLFEYTSKIPLQEIVNEIEKETNRMEKKTVDAVSPYTRPSKKKSKKYFLLIYAIMFLFAMILFIWSIKQITVNTKTTSDVSYIK